MFVHENAAEVEALRAPWMPPICSEERPRALRDPRHVREVSRLVRRSVARLLQRGMRPPSCDVDDLTQHVLAHLFAHEARALSSWQDSRGVSYPSYVWMIAERTAISLLRRRDHNPREEYTADPADLDQRVAPGRDSEDRLAARDHSRALVRRLDRELSPTGQRVLRALYAEDLTIEEASRSLGVSADALYTWRSRIRKHAEVISREI